MQEGLLPFINLHPMGQTHKTGFEPAVNLLRSYLQVVRPLIVLSMGHEVCPRFSAIDSFELTC